MGETALHARFEAVADLAGSDFETPSLESLARRRRGRRTNRLAMVGAVATVVAVAVVATRLGGTSGPTLGRITTPGVPVQAGHVTSSQLAHYRWTTIPDAPITAGRIETVAVWTGSRMIVWGGVSQRTDQLFGDGASYDPTTRTWQRLPESPLGPRQGSAYAWTGKQLFIWGGLVHNNPLSDGALYDPARNRWQVLPQLDVHGASIVEAAWTGHDVVLFTSGFRTRSAQVHAYNPVTNSWRTLPSITVSETEVLSIVALEAGNQLYVWMPVQTLANGSLTTGNVGYVYRPTTNSWQPTDVLPIADAYSVGPPTWTGDHILFGPAGVECDVCGGVPGVSTGTWADPSSGRLTKIPSWPLDELNGAESFNWTGAAILGLSGTRVAAWTPATQVWTPLPDSPYLAESAVQIWTGSELIVWGPLYVPPSTKPNAGYTPRVSRTTGLEFSRS